jgi:hypothetical protein
MNAKKLARKAARWSAASVGIGVAAYAAYAGTTWLRYGHVEASTGVESDSLLDRFMPTYEIVERHRTYVAAPAAVTLAAASEMDLQQLRIVRYIFKGRELILRSKPDEKARPRGIIALTRSLGWAVLAETPGREIVMGAVTQPWESDVVFHPVAPEAFASFNDPGYVKIVWTLRADALGDHASIFRTETRAVATDAVARLRFRRYWSFLSPGIVLIRRATLGPVRAEAERRARELHSRLELAVGAM